jgi:asparagine synthetase B (glutamine-hydrolysing)
MREAAKKLLPEKILRRPKRAIVDPQRKWLKEELREWVGDAIHSEAFASCGVFDVDAARTEFAEYCSFDGIPPTGFHIFQFVNIAHWYERIANGQSFQA